MAFFRIICRCSVLCLLGMLAFACAAQQFVSSPAVEVTGGRVTSFQTGSFQNPTKGVDILYLNAPANLNSIQGVVAGEYLNAGNGQFEDLGLNHILFTGATNVVAALGKYAGSKFTDYAFAISGISSKNLCVYYGTGAAEGSGNSSYDGGAVYPPTGGESGCMTLPTNTTTNPSVPNPPIFSYIAALPFTTNGVNSQLLVEDSANKLLYVISNNGQTSSNGLLNGFAVKSTINLAATDGPGPIYVGDFNDDGNIDFIVNGQTGYSATVYIGNGDGTFKAPVPYFSGHVYSMLMQDMDGDGFTDMVVEGDNGVITIHKGNGDGTFQANSEGGTSASPSAFAGNGGHLAAIGNVNNDTNLDILTTTPIGLSVLLGQGPINGSLAYTLKGIYNIGPGRSCFALASFGNGGLALAVDSPDGVALIQGDSSGDGGFMTSNAYSALAPALGATVGRFRNPASINMDVVVDTGAVQAQWLKGDGFGNFAAATPTNTDNPSGIQTGLWSNILSGDFNGDGKTDLAYSLTGYPLPAPGTTSIPGLYVQLGNGDGTFAAPVAITSSSAGAQSSNTFYGESVVGQFDGNATDDIANIDAGHDDTLLGQFNSGPIFSVGLNQPVSGNTNFNQVAAGFFKAGVTNKNQQDLVFQNGTKLVPYKNTINGKGNIFTAMPALTGPSPAANYAISTVLLTDVNGDGNGDIVTLYHNLLAPDLSNPSASTANLLYIWYGNGDGTFTTPTQTVALSRNFYLAAVADMNGDTLPDIVLSDGYVVGILYNQSGGIFKSDFNTCGGVSTCGEQHFLAGQGINSLSLQNVRGGSRPDVVVANGGATISNAVALEGASASSISLTANPADTNTGGITVLANAITSLPVTGTLTAFQEPSNYGAAFTITATLISTAGVAPAGLVYFYIDGTLLGEGVLSLTAGSTTTSSAIYTVPANNTYTGGTHTLTAIYYGDAANSQYNLSGTHSIQDVTTTTNLYLCVGPTAQCPSTGVISPPPPYIANLPMYYGQTWNGVAQVAASDGSTPTGTVTLTDTYSGAAPPPPSPLCTLAVTGGACGPSVGTTVGTSVGINVLTATYNGDSTHNASSSPSVTITVSPDTTIAALTGSPNPAPLGQPVTFTATLSGNYAAPTGPVIFMYGSTQLCSSNLVAGTGDTSTATCSTSSLPAGTDTITASYAATLDFQAASSTFSETITAPIAPNFTISATPNPVSVGVGYAALLTVTVTPQNGFAEGVNLTCGNLPTEATCTFAPAAIASGGGTSQLIMLPTAPHSCGSNTPYFVGGNGGGPSTAPFVLPALAGLLTIFLPGKRRWLRALAVVLLAAGAAQIAGCGNCTDLGTRPGSYTFQVVGTSTGTGTTESQGVTLNITI